MSRSSGTNENATAPEHKAVTAPAAPSAEPTVLYSPAGTEYRSSSPREITRLKARGYTDEKPKG